MGKHLEADARHDAVADIDRDHETIREIDHGIEEQSRIGRWSGPAESVEDRRQLAMTNAAEIDPHRACRPAPHTADIADRDGIPCYGPELLQGLRCAFAA